MPAGFLIPRRLDLEDKETTLRVVEEGLDRLRKLAFFPRVSVRSFPHPGVVGHRRRATADAAVGFTELFSSPALAPFPLLLLSTLSSPSPSVVAILIGDCAAAAAQLREVLPRSTTFGQKSLVCEDVARSLARLVERRRGQGEGGKESVRGPALFASRGAMRAVALRSPPVHHVSRRSADNREPRTM